MSRGITVICGNMRAAKVHGLIGGPGGDSGPRTSWGVRIIPRVTPARRNRSIIIAARAVMTPKSSRVRSAPTSPRLPSLCSASHLTSPHLASPYPRLVSLCPRLSQRCSGRGRPCSAVYRDLHYPASRLINVNVGSMLNRRTRPRQEDATQSCVI